MLKPEHQSLAVVPIDAVLAQIDKLKLFVELCRHGAEYAASLTEGIEVLRESNDPPTRSKYEKIYVESLGDVKRLESFAVEQSALEFPYLLEVACTRLWSILEAGVDDFAVTILRYPEYRESNIVKGLEGPLIEFTSSDESEQAQYLLDLLKLKLKATLKPGVGRLESVLDAVGFGGGIADMVRRALLELSELRNIIVHRSGRADARIVERCPWLSLRAGEHHGLGVTRLRQYVIAASWYALDVRARIVPQARIEEVKSKLLDALQTASKPDGGPVKAASDD